MAARRHGCKARRRFFPRAAAFAAGSGARRLSRFASWRRKAPHGEGNAVPGGLPGVSTNNGSARAAPLLTAGFCRDRPAQERAGTRIFPRRGGGLACRHDANRESRRRRSRRKALPRKKRGVLATMAAWLPFSGWPRCDGILGQYPRLTHPTRTKGPFWGPSSGAWRDAVVTGQAGLRAPEHHYNGATNCSSRHGFLLVLYAVLVVTLTFAMVRVIFVRWQDIRSGSLSRPRGPDNNHQRRAFFGPSHPSSHFVWLIDLAWHS